MTSNLQLDNPFLIVGASSSGSTLLGILLDHHPDIACGPEIGVLNKAEMYGEFSHVQKKISKWLKYGVPTRGYAEYAPFFFNLDAYFWTHTELVELAQQSANVREFYDKFFTRYLEQRKKKIWGENTLSNSYCLPQLLTLYPRLKIIHLIRDGRDSMCSVMGRGGSIYHSGAQWLYAVSSGLAFRGHQNYFELRYEQFVADPESHLKRLCEFIGVEFDPTMLEKKEDPYWNTHQNKSHHQSWKSTPFSGKISTSSVGRYKNDLSAEAEAVFWSLKLTDRARKLLGVEIEGTQDLMKKLGYATESDMKVGPISKDVRKEANTHNFRRIHKELIYQRRLWLPLVRIV